MEIKCPCGHKECTVCIYISDDSLWMKYKEKPDDDLEKRQYIVLTPNLVIDLIKELRSYLVKLTNDNEIQ